MHPPSTTSSSRSLASLHPPSPPSRPRVAGNPCRRQSSPIILHLPPHPPSPPSLPHFSLVLAASRRLSPSFTPLPRTLLSRLPFSLRLTPTIILAIFSGVKKCPKYFLSPTSSLRKLELKSRFVGSEPWGRGALSLLLNIDLTHFCVGLCLSNLFFSSAGRAE